MEFLDLREKGEAPSPEEFAERYPDIRKELLKQLSTISTVITGLRPDILSPTIGQSIGPYTLLREIGRGSMGVVYLVERRDDLEPLAMKFLPGLYTAENRTRSRFLREAETLKKLDHPNVVHVHEVGELAGSLYFVMDFVSGKSLDRVIESWRQGNNDLIERQPAAIASVIARVARGLADVHRHNVVHRDIKPSNILIDESGSPRLADFGLARDIQASSITATEEFLGTPFYSSPEQVKRSSNDIGPRSDIYSLGVTLYEVLSLRVPFEGQTASDIFGKILKGRPPPIRRFDPTIPPELAAVTHRAMERNPDRRFKDARELAEELDRFARNERTRTRPPGAASLCIGWVRRNVWLPIALTVCILLVVGIRVGHMFYKNYRLQEIMHGSDNAFLISRPEYVNCMDDAWDLASTDGQRYRVQARRFALMGGGMDRGADMRIDAASLAVRSHALDLLARQTDLAMPDIAPLLQVEPFFVNSAVISEKAPGQRPTILYQGREFPERCFTVLSHFRFGWRLATYRDGEYLSSEFPFDRPLDAGETVKQCRWSDLDGDGGMDILLLIQKPPLMRLEGALAGKDNYRRIDVASLDPGRAPRFLSMADVNGDRSADILVMCDTKGGADCSNYLFLLETDSSGNVSFREAGMKSGVALPTSRSSHHRTLGVVWVDLDRDGRLDIVEAGHWGKEESMNVGPPRVLRNRGNDEEGIPRFDDVSADVGLTMRKSGDFCSKAAAGDVNGDGIVDVVYGTIPPILYLGRKGGTFFDAWEEGANPAKAKQVASVALIDFDLDGDTDVFIGYSSARDQLLRNDGMEGSRVVFTEVARELGLADERELQSSVSWGTWLDIDLDGDLDLLVRRNPGFDRLYRNDVADGHWLKVFVEGPKGDPYAMGARITLFAGDRKWVRIQGAQHAGHFRQLRSVHFGLGKTAEYDRIEIVWPSGDRTELPGGQADRTVTAAFGKKR